MSEIKDVCTPILERITDGFFALDNNFVFTYLNKQAEILLGKKKEDLLGKVLWEECTADNQKPFLEAFTEAKKTRKLAEVEAFYSTTDIWLSAYIYPDENGYSAFFKDVSERRRSDESLKRVLESSPIIIWAVSKEGLLSHIEGRKAPLDGSNLDYIGKNIFDIFPEPENREIIERALYRQESFTVERNYKGEWFQTFYTPYNGGTLAVSSIITELKNTEQKLQKEQILRENFVAALTHDIKNPLSAAKTLTQLIQKFYLNTEDFKTPNKVNKYLTDIVHNLDRIDSMIQDLLDSNTIRAGEKLNLEKKWVNIQEIVSETVHTFEILYGSRFKVEAQPLIGKWNYGYIQRAIENLLANAVKYGDPEREITIKAIQVEQNRVEICVHNYGNLISPENQRTIFEQYKRTESAKSSGKRGWGIGLTLVKGIAEAHNGTVRVTSGQDGTVFKIILPFTTP